MSYEQEEARLLKLWESIATDDECLDSSESEDESNHQEEDETNITNEPASCEDVEMFNLEEFTHSNHLSFIGKDGLTRWKKFSPTPKSTKTRSENIIKILPGPSKFTQHLKTNRRLLRRSFLHTLASDLFQPCLKKRADIPNIPRSMRLRLKEITNQQISDPLSEKTNNGRCGFCDSKKNRKTRFKCEQCGIVLCLEHLSGLCIYCKNNIV